MLSCVVRLETLRLHVGKEALGGELRRAYAIRWLTLREDEPLEDLVIVLRDWLRESGQRTADIVSIDTADIVSIDIAAGTCLLLQHRESDRGARAGLIAALCDQLDVLHAVRFCDDLLCGDGHANPCSYAPALGIEPRSADSESARMPLRRSGLWGAAAAFSQFAFAARRGLRT